MRLQINFAVCEKKNKASVRKSSSKERPLISSFTNDSNSYSLSLWSSVCCFILLHCEETTIYTGFLQVSIGKHTTTHLTTFRCFVIQQALFFVTALLLLCICLQKDWRDLTNGLWSLMCSRIGTPTKQDLGTFRIFFFQNFDEHPRPAFYMVAPPSPQHRGKL